MIAQIRRQQKKQKQSKNIRLSNTPRSQAVAKNDTVAPDIASTFYFLYLSLPVKSTLRNLAVLCIVEAALCDLV